METDLVPLEPQRGPPPTDMYQWTFGEYPTVYRWIGFCRRVSLGVLREQSRPNFTYKFSGTDTRRRTPCLPSGNVETSRLREWVIRLLRP